MINDVLLHAQPTKKFVQVERSRGARRVSRERRRRVDHRRDHSDRRRLDRTVDGPARVATTTASTTSATKQQQAGSPQARAQRPRSDRPAPRIPGPGRARAAGRRRARRLPGRRLRGAARGRHRARLGDRHVDRRDQRRADRRQRAGESDARGCANSGRASSRAPDRTISQRVWTGLSNMSANLDDRDRRAFRPSSRPIPIAWMSSHTPLGVENAAYYTTAPLRETLAELVDLDASATQRKSASPSAPSTSRNGEMRYFDSRDEADRHRSRARVRRAAAGVPRGAHRRRSVLGRRHLLEHADRGGARRQAAPGLGDLHGQHVESGRPRARRRCGRSWAGRRTSSTRAAPRATSRGRSRSTICATSSARLRSTCRKRHATSPSRQGTRVVGLRHHDARRAPDRAEARRRGSHEGHRFHAGRHSRTLAGGLRRYQARCSSARRGSGRSIRWTAS